MPHFVVEYAQDLEDRIDIDGLLQGLYEVAAASGVMLAQDVKLRAVGYRHYRMPTAGDRFVHVTVSLLEGRSDEAKEGLAIALRERMAALLPEVESLSIDIRDMNPVAYKKRLL